MPVRRDVIKFDSNVPVIVKLDYADGREGENKNGKYVLYTVNDDAAAMFLTPTAHLALQRSHAQAGDHVQITKVQHGQNATSWDVRVMPPSEPPTPPAPGPRAVESSRAYLPPPQQRTQGANALAPQATPAAHDQRGTSHLSHALCLAIDAAVEASEYARSRNFSVTFLGSDIRAMANTVMINDQQGGRR